MNTASIEQIKSWLSQVVDPEIPVVSIEEMGILQKVEWRENQCLVYITPTYTACPAMGRIEDDIKQVLHENGVDGVSVITVFEPAWTTDMMSPSTKEKLRNYGIAPPLHSSCGNWHAGKGSIVSCPRCGSNQTQIVSPFGSTACKALYKCGDCLEPFDHFKCH